MRLSTRCIATIAIFVASSAPAHAQVQKERTVMMLDASHVVVTAASEQLLRPEMMQVGADVVDVFDYGDGAIKSFSLATGKVAHSIGRFGGGPAEFANPTSMSIAADGRVWIYDPDQQRMSIFSPDLKLQREIKPASQFERFALYGNAWVGFGLGGANAFGTVFNDAGKATSDIVAPPWVAALDQMGRGFLTTGGAEEWAVAFQYTGRIMVLAQGSHALRELLVVEVRPALRDTVFAGGAVRKRNPESVTTARSIAYDRGLLYVLDGGLGHTANKYIDVYDVKKLAYLHSYLLTRPASAIGVNADGIAVMESSDDAPSIWFYPFRKGAR